MISVRGFRRQIDDQRQERAVEFEHIHAQPEGGEIFFTGVPELAQGQLGKGAVMKQLHFASQPGLGRNRGQAAFRQRAAPHLRAPGPVGAMRAGEKRGTDLRQGKAAVGGVDQPIQMGTQLTRLIALAAQLGERRTR